MTRSQNMANWKYESESQTDHSYFAFENLERLKKAQNFIII